MRDSASRIVRLGCGCALGLTALAASFACDSYSTPTTSTPATTASANLTETRVGTVQGHGLAWVNFEMSREGPVTLGIDPVLFLTLRTGRCPETCGDFVANSDNGSLTFQAPADVNSVLIGNPFDDPKPFTLTVTHSR